MEKWKDIKGYENLYKVSNLGRVKSLERNVVGNRGGSYKIEEKILKCGKECRGYLIVFLCKEGKKKKYKVHRLVAQAFLDNPNNLSQVNHKDEDKTNNMVWLNDDGSVDYNKSNLEWCDNKYNVNYGTRNKRISKAKSIPILQFTKNDEFLRRWDNATEVSRELGINNCSIYSCLKRKKYKSAGGYVWKYDTIDNYLIGVLNKSFIENGLKNKKVA